MDVGCYCVSIMRLITGEEPSKLAAFGVYNDNGVDVQTAAALQFPSGVVGHFDCGVLTSNKQTYEIRGDEGRIKVDEAFVIPADRPTTIQYWNGKGDYEAITIPAAGEYTVMMEDFGASLLLGRPHPFPPEDAIRMMEALDTLRASVAK
jgi:predicted dehydrogenase